jgi:hypothetical protein
LHAALGRHPTLAAALLGSGQIGILSANHDGWIDTPHVTILRTPHSARDERLVLDIQTPPEHLPYSIDVAGAGWQHTVPVQSRGVLRVELPAPPSSPELVTLALESAELKADPSSLGVRVTFDPPEDRSKSADEDEDDEDRE